MTNTFNEQVIAEFRANDGKVGGPFAGAPMVLLNSVGVRSGKTYTTPLVTFESAGNLYIIASAGGRSEHPGWYRHLKAQPDVTIEIGSETRDVTAHELDQAERAEIWPKIVERMPGFGEYQANTGGRIIPVFRLDPH